MNTTTKMVFFDQKCECVECGVKYIARTVMKQRPEHQVCGFCNMTRD